MIDIVNGEQSRAWMDVENHGGERKRYFKGPAAPPGATDDVTFQNGKLWLRPEFHQLNELPESFIADMGQASCGPMPGLPVIGGWGQKRYQYIQK